MDEGYKTETYEDHLGFLTLGVGHLVLDVDPEDFDPMRINQSQFFVKFQYLIGL